MLYINREIVQSRICNFMEDSLQKIMEFNLKYYNYNIFQRKEYWLYYYIKSDFKEI